MFKVASRSDEKTNIKIRTRMFSANWFCLCGLCFIIIILVLMSRHIITLHKLIIIYLTILCMYYSKYFKIIYLFSYN